MIGVSLSEPHGSVAAGGQNGQLLAPVHTYCTMQCTFVMNVYMYTTWWKNSAWLGTHIT